MQIFKVTVLGLAFCFSGCDHHSESERTHLHTSKYAGEENRAIKSLSESDIKELQNGSGWGLAKTAELNGVPGPAHLLELKKEIELDESQVESIQQLFDHMQAEAIAHGQQLIEQEKQLEERFKADIPDSTELKILLNEIGSTRSKLRFVHLDSHLKTPDILTAEQIKKYNDLRGYFAEDPCEKVPAGHSAEMWKKHNNCG